MLKLDLSATPREPQWHDIIPGIRFLVDPIDTFTMTLAASRVPDDIVEDRGTYASVETAKIVVREWEGVGDQDENAIPVSPDGLVALFRAAPLAYAVWHSKIYLPAFAGSMAREAEKNG